MRSIILFSEKQRFNQVWLWAIILGLDALFIFGLIWQLYLQRPFGDRPMNDAGLVITAILVGLFTYWFYTLRLETRISAEGIEVRFIPFQHRVEFYPWDRIERAFVRRYKPIREYGGWGLRGFGKNRALNVSGDEGIQLLLNDGSRLLIGTRKPQEASQVLSSLGQGVPEFVPPSM